MRPVSWPTYALFLPLVLQLLWGWQHPQSLVLGLWVLGWLISYVSCMIGLAGWLEQTEKPRDE